MIRPPLWASFATITATAVVALSIDATMPDRHAIQTMTALGLVSILLAYWQGLAYRADMKRAAKWFADATAVRDREAASYRRMVEAATTAPCPTTALHLPPTQRIEAHR